MTILLLIGGCGPSQEISRVDPETKTDYSSKWNDTDAKLVAEEMTSTILTAPWLQNTESEPVIIVGKIKNNTMEHIQTDIFIKEIEKEIVNSPRAKIVADPEQREQIRVERSDQQKHASYESATSLAEELGADYMLVGNINSNVQKTADGTKASKYYTVNLELINVKTNNKAWIGDKEIKKKVQRDKVSW